MAYVEFFNIPLLWRGLAVLLGLLSEVNLYGAAQLPKLPPFHSVLGSQAPEGEIGIQGLHQTLLHFSKFLSDWPHYCIQTIMSTLLCYFKAILPPNFAQCNPYTWNVPFLLLNLYELL